MERVQILKKVSSIIEICKYRAGVYANCEITLMYWEVGHYVNSVVLYGNRATLWKENCGGAGVTIKLVAFH